MNDINQTLQSIFAMRNSGQNPQAIMQILIQQNPQARQMIAQLQNMSQGRNPREFFAQLAKQSGVNEQNMNALMQLFGNK
jgi:hypothetical protein